MSRMGQFYPGRQTLVCGVKELVIRTGKGEFTMVLGKSPVKYTMSFDKLREVKHTLWKNPKGVLVWIIPIEEFKTTLSKKDAQKTAEAFMKEFPSKKTEKETNTLF